MMKKIVWGLISCLMVLSLILASCGPAAEEEEEVVVGEEEEEEEEEGGVVTKPEKPRYGGTITLRGGDPMGFDQAFTSRIMTHVLGPVSDVLIGLDWTKGPAGTGDTTWTRGTLGRHTLLTGHLATSWDLPDDETIVYYLRKGVHWQNIPPVNGREFTADDVVFNMKRLNDAETNRAPEKDRPKSFTALDKYTVEVKVPPEKQGQLLFELGGGAAAACAYFFPPEVFEQYGDMRDWKHVIGNGPFILKDYIPASSITYVRNPDYWDTNPIGLGKGDQLPYLDVQERLVIDDASTLTAALRTGKLDLHGLGRAQGQTWEDAALLLKQTKMESLKKVADLQWIWARLDKPELPIYNKDVRRAMNMAIDRELIAETYYGGTATTYNSPWPPTPDYAPYYTPLEEQPQEVQELFSYNPEKAKQLVAEAGYPDGFKTKIVCGTASVDFLSLIREFFLDIGVDMEIVPQDTGVFRNTMAQRTHEEMIYSLHLLGSPAGLANYRIEHTDDRAMYENPRVRVAYDNISAMIGKDEPGIVRELKEISQFILSEVVAIYLPQTYNYTLWWPWVKNYHGEGFEDGAFAPRYMWIDEDLKKSMGY